MDGAPRRVRPYTSSTPTLMCDTSHKRDRALSLLHCDGYVDARAKSCFTFSYATCCRRRSRYAGRDPFAMKYREFRDSRDEQWSVWEVQPSSMERRLRDDPERRPPVERRHSAQIRRLT